MSYILEALRRSQAERERGHVPGLHAQPVAADATGDTQRAAPAPWVLWLAAGAGLLALVALLLWWTRPAPVLVAAPVAAPAPATTTANMPAPTPAPSPTAATANAPAPAPAATPAADSSQVPVSPATPAPAPARSLPIVVSAPPAGPSAAPTTAPATALPSTSDAPPTPVLPRNTRTPTVAELSPDQRRELPPLVLGGSVWSDNAASRFVIFNGQIVHEGQPAAPGVVVERIAPKAAQLRWRGLLFEVPL